VRIKNTSVLYLGVGKHKLQMKKLLFILPLLISIIFVKAQFGPRNLLVYRTDNANQVYSVDIDNDGDFDVLSADTIIAWYENLGGEFGNQKIISKDGSGHLQAIDIDNDGDADVLSSTQTNEIVWYENLGGGIIDMNPNIISQPNPISSIYSADLDLDGDNDVLAILKVSMFYRKLVWYENIGGGTFGNEILISNNITGASKVITSDLDNDGDLDVLTSATGLSKISWYENLGGGIIDTTQQLIAPNINNPNDVHAADIDNDGDNDVLSTSFISNIVLWYENLGGGVFDTNQNTISNMALGAKMVYTSDLDGDGDLDILSGSGTDNKIAWYENMGSGVIDTNQKIITLNADYPTSIYIKDLDMDGDMDVLSSSSEDEKVVWYKNDGSGIFGREQHISSSIHDGRAIISIDFDNDGDIDILSASENDSKIAWYENAGGGIFKPQKVINPNNAATPNIKGLKSIYVTDIDADGDNDVLFASTIDKKLGWYENVGGEVFDTVQNVITNSTSGANSIFSIDLDNDGDNDVLSALNDKIAWYENLGGGIIDTVQNVIYISANGANSIFSIDLDNDGDNDVLSASYFDDNIAWYENLGGGVFGGQQILSTNADGASYVHADDIDGDGDNDVLSVSPLDYKVAWYENLGTGSFGPQQIITNDIFGKSVNTCDIDGDGDIDVLTSSLSNPKIVWFENIGGGIIDTNKNIINSGSFLEVSSWLISSGDYDNDGDPDIASIGQFYIEWYENFYNSPYKFSGYLFYDMNQNKIKDTNEIGLSFFQVSISPNNAYSYSSLGYYSFTTDSTTHTLNPYIAPYWGLTTDSSSYTRTPTVLTPSIDSLNFGFYPDTIITIINPSLTGGFPRCNTNVNYWINIQNQGTTIPSGFIHLQLDDSITYVSATIPPDSINGQNIYWHYDSLFFFSSEMINLQVQMPTFTSMGDLLTSILTVHELDSLGSGAIIYSNTDTLKQVSVCAYDPNDKSVTPEGMGSEGYILQNQKLEYLIRFQNTGNDTAITVMVRDQLDDNLDWSSLQPIASSHPMQVWIEQDGEAVFKFENIMLPDSSTDFLGSQGFIMFSIQPKSGLVPLTPIYNTSNIYFDNNPAVITNTVLNTIYDCSIMSSTLNSIATEYCQFDTVNISYSDVHTFNNHSIDIDGFYYSSSTSLNWYADSVGIFNLTFNTSNLYCFEDTTITIKVNPTYIINQNDTICQGDSLLIYGTYQNTSGVYYDSLQTTLGCDSIFSTNLTVKPLPNVSLAVFNPDTLCDNASAVTLPIGSPSGGNYTGNGVIGGNFDPAFAGIGTHDIIYTYIDSNSCINSDTTIITVQLCTGIDNIGNDFGILIYPNPNAGQFTIEKPSDLNKEVQVKLLDASSKLIISDKISIGKQKVEIDITKYSKGIYYLQLTVDDKHFVKQILKN
jgi:type IX secretion system substrate protein/VCBS repeat protein